jgi:hypothetical protein
MPIQVRREATARRRGGMMERTRPAYLIPGGFAGDEADELEDVGQRNPGPDCGKVNARHGWSLRTESRGIIRAGAAWEAPMGTEKEPVVLLG